MEKEIHNIFQNDDGVSINEYDIDKALDKTVFILKDDFPKIDIGEKEDSIPDILDKSLKEKYKSNLSLAEDLNDFLKDESIYIENDDDLDLPDIDSPDMDLIEQNIKENIPLENNLIEYNNLEEKNIKYANTNDISFPDIDDADYIDESDYMDQNLYDDYVIQLSGNQLDIITNSTDIIRNNRDYYKKDWVYNNKLYPHEEFSFDWNFKKSLVGSKDKSVIVDDDTLKELDGAIKYEKVHEANDEADNLDESIIVDEDILNKLSDDTEKERPFEDSISIDEKALSNFMEESIVTKKDSIYYIDELIGNADNCIDSEEPPIKNVVSTTGEDVFGDTLDCEKDVIEESITVDDETLNDFEDVIHKKEILDSTDDLINNKSFENLDDVDLEEIVLESDNEHIKDSDLKELEKVASDDNNSKEDKMDNENELITINNDVTDFVGNNGESNKSSKSIDSFDASDELLEEEAPISEEIELETISDTQNINTIDNEFTLEDDMPIDIDIKPNTVNYNDNEDFDGEITQTDLDKAIKIYESENEDDQNVNISQLKSESLLSDEDIDKFQKLFLYFKTIVEQMPDNASHDFSKTEFYDMYSSLFRKF